MIDYDLKKLKELFQEPHFQELIEDKDWDTLIEEGYFYNIEHENNLASFIIYKLNYPLLEQFDEIPKYCFYEDENIQGDFIIPDNITSIKEDAFSNCKNLTSAEIPSSVISIRFGAFYDCTSLKSITIPSYVKIIEGWAFVGCIGLESVTILSSTTSIKNYSFMGCKNLKDVYYKGTREQFEKIVDSEENHYLLNATFHQI